MISSTLKVSQKLIYNRSSLYLFGLRSSSCKDQHQNEGSKSNFCKEILKIEGPRSSSCKDQRRKEDSNLNKIKIIGANGDTIENNVVRDIKVYSNNDELDLTFNDYIGAYKSKTTWEITRALVVYLLCTSRILVNNNLSVMKWTQKILGQRIFRRLMKLSFYGHFVGGEDENKVKPTLERLAKCGIHPILDYSVEEDISEAEAEKRMVDTPTSLPQYQSNKLFADRRKKVKSAKTYFYLNEATCERNMEIFLKSLDAVKEYGDGITAIKLTALGRPDLLLQLSEVIARSRHYMHKLMGGSGNVMKLGVLKEDVLKRLRDTGTSSEHIDRFFRNITADSEGIIHIFPWAGIINYEEKLSTTFVVPDIKTGKMVKLTSQLTEKEEEIFQNMIRRVNIVVQHASEINVAVMVDAEQTYFQPAISRITLELMRKYNKEEPIVRNTYQCYLRDIIKELATDLEQARRQKFCFGAKLVRGAYLSQERERAITLDYPDPTNPTFKATTAMYNKALQTVLNRIVEVKKDPEAKKVVIMVASHNEETVRYAIEQMQDHGIEPSEKLVSFGQLYGMCDYITFPLGQAGYSVYKYIPYGPVLEVLPYLSRRAQENKGMLKNTKERKLLRKALFRRILHPSNAKNACTNENKK